MSNIKQFSRVTISAIWRAGLTPREAYLNSFSSGVVGMYTEHPSSCGVQ